jgi:hypothetical protein
VETYPLGESKMFRSKTSVLFLGVAVLALCVYAAPAQAAAIPVPNFSFEEPVLGPVGEGDLAKTAYQGFGWETTSTRVGYGDWEMANLGSLGWFPGGGVTGDQELIGNATGFIARTQGQDLGVNLAANTTYTLQVDLINDWGYVPSRLLQYDIALHAGSNEVGRLTGDQTFADAATGKLELDLTAITGASPAGLGQPLWIELGSHHGNTVYDNVRLDASPVPEPSSVVLLISALIGLVAYAWRKRR